MHIQEVRLMESRPLPPAVEPCDRRRRDVVVGWMILGWKCGHVGLTTGGGLCGKPRQSLAGGEAAGSRGQTL